MSWGAFLIGLVVSALVHLWLLGLPRPETDPPAIVRIVPVVETELARIDVPETPPETEPDTGPPPVEPAPDPPLTKLFEPPTAGTDERGDLKGTTEGEPSPELRINWGSDSQAMAVLAAGDMLVVVLDVGGIQPVIKVQVEREGGTWRRRPFKGAARYSNRLRIVDHVPAFGGMRRALSLRDGERLAILVPNDVERMLESAQMQAAFRQGLTMTQIENFAGHFTLFNGSLAFDVTHVGPATTSAMP